MEHENNAKPLASGDSYGAVIPVVAEAFAARKYIGRLVAREDLVSLEVGLSMPEQDPAQPEDEFLPDQDAILRDLEILATEEAVRFYLKQND